MSTVNDLAKELAELDREIKSAEAKKAAVREKIFAYATEDNRKKILPRKIVKISAGFWKLTKLSEPHFFATRHPGWNIIGKDSNIEEATYILEKDPDYLPWSFVEPETKIVVGKRISEHTPDYDWSTLAAERPDIFEKIATPKISYELNPLGLQEAYESIPDILSILSRHILLKRPTKALAPIKAYKEDDEDC